MMSEPTQTFPAFSTNQSSFHGGEKRPFAYSVTELVATTDTDYSTPVVKTESRHHQFFWLSLLQALKCGEGFLPLFQSVEDRKRKQDPVHGPLGAYKKVCDMNRILLTQQAIQSFEANDTDNTALNHEDKIQQDYTKDTKKSRINEQQKPELTFDSKHCINQVSNIEESIPQSGGILAETAGGDFKIHEMTVDPEENVVSKILSFFNERVHENATILSASGQVSTFVIHQSGSLVRHEGHFEILSLSGQCTYTRGAGGVQRQNCTLAISVVKPDTSVLGGVIESLLVAATPIQLVITTFK
ncbi:hypothetical protein TanjilG_17103 [Lupinus angustifolius]|uniref:AT-hook motif nuclear-localized protein n=1 Tax=Lupinus angustifolius TaxID=3871 RepID=A0A4P1R0J7_LUPAN|nr:hypothetical protein TanjilG_17103 [Lupinus angustifolius]